MSKVGHSVANICILFTISLSDVWFGCWICNIKVFFSPYVSFGICPHMNDDNKDQLKGKDLLVAYYDVDYEKNPKGSNYWRNR